MILLPLITRWGEGCVGALLLALATLGASAAEPKRVLILDPFGRNVAPFTTVVSEFRTTLARELGEPVDIYELPLELTRFSGAEGEKPLVTFLEGRLKEQSVDLVVPVGTAGMQFAARHRNQLFSDTPVLVLASEPRMMSPELLKTKATAVTQKVSLPGMVEDILQLQPQTTNIVVVFGASALERFWTDQCRREFQVFTNRVRFTWVNDLTLEEILKQCAKLPPRSFILHGLFVVDAAGVPCERNEALRRLHGTANAPIFGYYTSELGLGSIGGRLFQDTKVGTQAALTAARILRGEQPEHIPVQVLDPTLPTYDWRELKRWGISDATLPANSILQFRQPTPWERYRWHVIGTAAFCFLQAALIVGLLVNRSKRKQGEAAAKLIADISSKFVNVPPDEVDREIMEAERRICEALGLDVAVLWQWSDGTPGFFTLTHFYSAVNRAQTPEGMNSHDTFPWVEQQVLSGRIVALSTMDSLPAEASRDREVARQMGIKSSLTIPLSVGGRSAVGALCFNTLRSHRDWPSAVVKRLEVVAQIFANALARKRAEQTLRESEERLNLAVNSADAGLWVMDCRTLEFWASEKARVLFGYSPDELINLSTFKASVHPDDWALVQHSLDRAMQAGEPINVEYRIRLGDQRERWIASRGRAFSTANGKPERLQGLSMDITERKRTEQQVRQLSLAVEQSPVAVIITDLEGRMIYVNRKFCEVSGYSLSECLGQNSRILKSGEIPAETYQEMWTSITSGHTWRGEFHNRRKNGELYWEWEVISPLFDTAGKITHFVGVKEDITARREAEAELLRQRAELAHVARVSTMGELAAAVAHELNQPLGAILANAEAAELFLNQNPPALEELHLILADIRKDDERAGEVIRRMRALLRKHELQRLPLEVNSLVEDVLQLVSGEAALRNITLTADLAPVLPRVAGDHVHLQQVLLNLVLNGMDAMADQPRERRRISVQTRLVADGRIVLAVSDSGHGLAPDKLPRLFEPFYTTKPNGMGMGLSISRSIVEVHHGRIWAENNESGGATFRISLPAMVEGTKL